ncbi:hypothetical protein GCM10022419_128770 [Nonomuraea rosea]|uniref:Uncharacterized protein n=1 Tax=Nonomuraea rosea TaxID=638574 RepID=A0ABP6ZXJ0_9ACTN
MLGGSAPGLTTLTFSSADGRQQFAISIARSTVDDNAVVPAMIKTVKTVKAVLCPTA